MAETEQMSVAEKEPKKRRKQSIGERIFDFVIYGPVNFFGTLFLTAWMADGLEYGTRGKAFFEGMSGALRKGGLSPKTAYEATKTTTLMMGGNTMLIPIKFAEHRKVGIASTLNRWLGDKTDPAEIEAAPKQTWYSLLGGRLVAWGIVFGSFKTAGKFFGEQMGKFEHGVGKWFADLYKQPTHKSTIFFWNSAGYLTKKIGRLEEQLKPLKATGKALTASEGALVKQLEARILKLGQSVKGLETRAYAFGKIYALDVFATTMAVVLLYGFSRVFAGQREKKHENENKHPEWEKKQLPSVSSSKEKTAHLPEAKAAPRAEVVASSVSAEKITANAAPSLGA